MEIYLLLIFKHNGISSIKIWVCVSTILCWNCRVFGREGWEDYIECHVFVFGGLRWCPSCSCVTLCFVIVDMIRGVISHRAVHTADRMPIFAWKRMAYVWVIIRHLGGKRLRWSLSERNFSFRVDDVSRGRPGCVLHRRTRKFATGDVWIVLKSWVLCSWNPSRTSMERFEWGCCIWMGLRHMPWPYFEVMEGWRLFLSFFYMTLPKRTQHVCTSIFSFPFYSVWKKTHIQVFDTQIYQIVKQDSCCAVVGINTVRLFFCTEHGEYSFFSIIHKVHVDTKWVSSSIFFTFLSVTFLSTTDTSRPVPIFRRHVISVPRLWPLRRHGASVLCCTETYV